MDSVFYAKVWMVCSSPGKPSSLSHKGEIPVLLVMIQSLWVLWGHFRWCTAVLFTGDHDTRFSPSYITSGPLGLNEEKQYSNPDEASLFATSHRTRHKWRQDVNHCWSLSFSWLLGGKYVCLYFLFFLWSYLLTGDRFWPLLVCHQLLSSLTDECSVLLVLAAVGLSERELQSYFWTSLQP